MPTDMISLAGGASEESSEEVQSINVSKEDLEKIARELNIKTPFINLSRSLGGFSYSRSLDFDSIVAVLAAFSNFSNLDIPEVLQKDLSTSSGEKLTFEYVEDDKYKVYYTYGENPWKQLTGW